MTRSSMIFVRIFSILALSLATGCVTDDGGADPAGGGGGGGGDEPFVNGLPASEYYAQFAWQTTQTGVEGAMAFPASGGRDASLVQFFLMPQGQLELFYAEGSGSVSPTGWSLNIDTSTQRRRAGQWRVDGARLVLDGFMACDGFELNDRPALRCTLTQAIGSAAAQGRTGTFKPRSSMSSPDDSEFAGYTP